MTANANDSPSDSSMSRTAWEVMAVDVTCTCGAVFQARSSRARYCSDRCRKRRQRGGGVVQQLPLTPDTPEFGPVATTTMRDLAAVDRLDTPLGWSCVQLARRLDSPGMDTGSAMAAVAARLEATLASATRGLGRASSPQQLRDELSERRQRHGA